MDTCWYSCLGGFTIAILSYPQLQQYAQQAGFTGQNVNIIAAIAMAESGGDTTIRGKNDNRDRGVLQINSGAHPEVSDQCAFDPLCAFQSAFRISGGVDFRQWCTFWSDAACGSKGGTISGSTAPYRQFLPGSTGTPFMTNDSSNSSSPGSITGAALGSPTSCQPWDIPCLLSELVHTDAFQRVNIVMVGLILGIIGIFVLFVGHGAEVKSG